MTDPEGRESRPTKTDLEALSEKLEVLNARHKPIYEPTRDSASNMAEGFKYASEFSAAILVGAALGWGVDKLTGLSPWGLLIGLFLGMCAGILTIVRAAQDGMDGSGTDLPPEPFEDEDT